ncbi:MAG: hypothetical protein JWO52_5584 [Gammaproteobacteria bacterium]|nr:hypothetical protein [Gammaproteobacteria bacterium]
MGHSITFDFHANRFWIGCKGLSATFRKIVH